MRFLSVVIWIVIIIAIAVPIFLYGAFGRPWLSFNWKDVVENDSVSGILLRSQTWRGNVEVTGDVYVVWWAKINIEPGSIIKIATSDDQKAGQSPAAGVGAQISDEDPTNTKEYAQSHVHINGKVKAIGTIEEPIQFISASLEPNYADWQGILLRSGSIMHNTKIFHAQSGLVATGDMEIDRVEVAEMLWDCLRISRGRVEVSNSKFSLCWQRGIAVMDDSNSVITNNTIERSAIGLSLLQNAHPQVTRNKFINNAIAVYLETTGIGIVYENNEMSSPSGPVVDGGSYAGQVIYPNTWEPGEGISIEGTNLL